ncbi:hypothetical protein J3E73DRAFT_376206 [Bipolaris maydis]|nr:hypothetical protein J3E73DRAFT_376206 [Bipolaris maydis]
MDMDRKLSSEKPASVDVDEAAGVTEVLNASGHKQELERNLVYSISAPLVSRLATFGLRWEALLSLRSTMGACWRHLRFITVSCFYFMIAACIAEMASAIPSSAGVYHWASVTGGAKFGKVIGFYAGWYVQWKTPDGIEVNSSQVECFGLDFGTASITSILSTQIISMYGLFHPGYAYERWHVFIVYLILTWISCAIVMFANRALPKLTNIGLFFILVGVFVTIMVCAIMPSRTGKGYASSEFVWKQWSNQTGWSSDGFVFCAGMLNGAFAVGTPDCVSHLAEELPAHAPTSPKRFSLNTQSASDCLLLHHRNLLNDLETLFSNPWPFPSPNSTVKPQTRTAAPSASSSGRMLWTLGRDDATPFSHWVGKIDTKWENPFNATVACGVINTALGCIYIGSSTAFNAFVGSFSILCSLSYLAFIVPNILSRRKRVVRGPFTMSDPVFYIVACLASGYMVAWIPIYCFPTARPFDYTTMNYTSALTGGVTILLGGWYLWIRNKGYVGPRRLVESLQSGEVPGLEGEEKM